MSDTDKFTEKEKQAMKDIRKNTDLFGDPKTMKEECGHYHIFTAEDINMEVKSAKGVMGSMEKKGLIFDFEHSGIGGVKVWYIRCEDIQEAIGMVENGYDHSITHREGEGW